ncbi:MAG: BlaI/MecI/CopY family transcriptional regulator [Muribaculaceae bacterium]|nr:BlaI/MecI/CopY family transcriptional regulator [Muribaculaceae bacterium]
MKTLTEKEEEIMRKLWTKDEMIAREVWELYPEPRPHFNTVTTFLRILEQKGWVKHRSIGNTNLYRAVVSKEEVGRNSLKNLIMNFFNGSAAGMVNALLKDENISDDEIKELINLVENKKK